MPHSHDSDNRPGGQRRRDDRPSGRDDRPRSSHEGGRDRRDSRERRPSQGSGRRGQERRPAGPPPHEEDKWSQISDDEIRSGTRQLIQDSNLLETGFGARRFYFVARDGRVQFLDISEDLASRLANGMAAIVELPGEIPEEYSVIPRGLALRVRSVEPLLVRFLNEGF